MICNKLCNDFLRHAEESAFEVVRRFRNRGLNRDVAIEMASESLGLPQRRVWSLVYSQPIVLARAEYRRLQLGYIGFLQAEQEELKRQIAVLNAREQEEKGRFARLEQEGESV